MRNEGDIGWGCDYLIAVTSDKKCEEKRSKL